MEYTVSNRYFNFSQRIFILTVIFDVLSHTLHHPLMMAVMYAVPFVSADDVWMNGNCCLEGCAEKRASETNSRPPQVTEKAIGIRIEWK